MDRIWHVTFAAAWMLTLAEGITLFAVLSMLGRIHLRMSAEGHVLITDDGPDLHSRVPDLTLSSVPGQAISLSCHRRRNLIVIYVSPNCSPCKTLLKAIEPCRRGLHHPPDFLVILEGSPEDAEQVVDKYRLRIPIVADSDDAIRVRLAIQRTPFGFHIDTEGILRMKGVINDRSQLEGLVRRQGRSSPRHAWEAVEELAAPMPSAG